ncbi:hypothetical protein C8J28_1508 [Cereibacter azotoformans]|uniref:Transposase n=1 Tax=Cereibacter azotoformans TaxID=43057 RepID=A0A2T5JJI6_9RHOB|nr:hypothetical protein C8J28_1508 [Cereibacter azotoformans]
MVHRHSPVSTKRLTLGADKAYDAEEFVRDLKQACVTPHVAQKARFYAINGRTTRHEGYALSQRCRTKIDLRRANDPLDRCLILLTYGWPKTVGPMAQMMLHGAARVGARFTFTMAACNLSRLPRLPAFTGMSEGATTMQSCPSSVSWRWRPWPQGPAS